MRVLTIAFLLIISIILMLSCSTDSTPVYQLNTSAEPAEAGSVTQSAAEAEQGETITITANANEHWVFDLWTGDHSGPENPASILMDRDKSVTALFEKRDYPLTITIEGEGEVEQEIIQAKTTEYAHGTVVKLTAIPETGWAFVGWTGDVESTENPYELTVSQQTSLTAVFEVITYPLTVETIGEGQVQQKIVQAKTTEYDYGTVVELTAVAEQNWVFMNWAGDVTGSENPVTITIDEPKSVTAEFERSFTLSTTVVPEEAGSITPDAGEYLRDTTFDVEAVANYGWKFVRWEGDFSGSTNPFSLTMNGNKSLIAHFERAEFTLEIETQGEGSVNIELISGTQTTDGFLYESVVRLTALPDEDWNFIEWQGDATGEDETIEITIEENVSITAVFSEFAGGDGSASNPYHVANLHQLQRVGSYLDKHFIQIADIDASETKEWIREPDYDEGFIPIGSQSQKFTGSYDGQGFEIIDLKIQRITYDEISIGLFSYLEGGTLENIILDINVGFIFSGNAGGLVGLNNGIIDNVVVSGGVFSDGDFDNDSFFGGIVGLNLGKIRNSESNAGAGFWSNSGTAGGLVGRNEGEIDDSFSSAAGRIGSPANVGDSSAGLVGTNFGTIRRSYSTADIDVDNSAAGLVLYNFGTIEYSYSIGDISTSGGAAGLVLYNSGTIENSYSTGDISVYNDIGGETIAAGLVGANGGNGKIIRSFSNRTISASAFQLSIFVGGLVGINVGKAEIIQSYSLGDIRTNDNSETINIGGIAGLNSSIITETYSTSKITFNSQNDNSNIVNIGGVIGLQEDDAIINNSYWDVQASQINDGIGSGEGSVNDIVGLQTSQMQGSSVRDNMPGFDWDNIWRTITSSYPILWWQVE